MKTFSGILFAEDSDGRRIELGKVEQQRAVSMAEVRRTLMDSFWDNRLDGQCLPRFSIAREEESEPN